MIVQSKENKSQGSLVDLLGGNTKNSSAAKSNDLFSKLLASIGIHGKGDENKIVKTNDFKAVIDPKNKLSTLPTSTTELKTSQMKELQTLLSGKEGKEATLVSTELLENMTNDQMRTLINRAKDYLKNEISAKSPEYQADPKSLPKTLGALVKLAEKLGLEPQSISLATIVNEPEEKASFPNELLSKPLFEAKAIAALPATVMEESAPIEAITQLLSELKNKEQKNTKPLSTETSVQEKSDKAETQPLTTLLQAMDKKEEKTVSTSVSEKADPIKIASTSTAATNKTDALIALLKESNDAKEIKSESTKVEGESSKSLHVPKADSLEVKAKEAQQSMRHFASDLKEAVQEYKPPFTRLTMKLNPEKLGEVEVTLVQRGNNVHVNIQSNNANSVAFLAHNATELKAQLASQGIQNATMNFMSGGDSQNQQAGQQQQQGQQQRFRAYESFEELNLNEEQISALEIIIPHYA